MSIEKPLYKPTSIKNLPLTHNLTNQTFITSCQGYLATIFLKLHVSKCLSVSVCLSLSVCLFVCLFGCYPAPVIIFAKCLYCFCQLWFCDTNIIFISHHPSFFVPFFHPSFGWEFKTLSPRGMVYPYPSVEWISCLR